MHTVAASRSAGTEPASQQAAQVLVLVGGHSVTQREALCSASSPTLQDSPPTRRAPAGQHAATRGSGRPLATKIMMTLLNKSVRRPTHNEVATVRSPQSCGASKILLGMAFAKDPC
jgi:hypothetical protein